MRRPTGYNPRMLRLDWQDQIVSVLDQGLRCLFPSGSAARASPARGIPEKTLSATERCDSIAMMRVNHAGEIAAQALYSGQSILARSEETRRQLLSAAREERDHLLWCRDRLNELGGRRSLLDPFWFGGSLAVGLLAGSVGDRISLGFVVETERQVEAHLNDHLQKLPARDERSRAVLERMAEDEAHHGTTAKLAGGAELPWPVRRLMGLGGGILRRTALRV
jgi:3-demethoxyubiquinol 3-hydroxylase